MIGTTNNFIQQATQLDTNKDQGIDESETKYDFIKTEISYSKEELSSVSSFRDNLDRIPEMTQIQRNEYHKKMGLV